MGRRREEEKKRWQFKHGSRNYATSTPYEYSEQIVNGISGNLQFAQYWITLAMVSINLKKFTSNENFHVGEMLFLSYSVVKQLENDLGHF